MGHRMFGSCMEGAGQATPTHSSQICVACCCLCCCFIRIPFAQPNQSPPTNFRRPVSLGGKLYVCGDHRDSATFDAAILSGRRAAEALLGDAAAAPGGGASAGSEAQQTVGASV